MNTKDIRHKGKNAKTSIFDIKRVNKRQFTPKPLKCLTVIENFFPPLLSKSESEKVTPRAVCLNKPIQHNRIVLFLIFLFNFQRMYIAFTRAFNNHILSPPSNMIPCEQPVKPHPVIRRLFKGDHILYFYFLPF